MSEISDWQARRRGSLSFHPAIQKHEWICEIEFVSKISLRGDVNDSRFCHLIKDSTGIDLPLVHGGVAKSDVAKALWLGPDEWLVVGELAALQEIPRRLTQAPSDIHACAVDVGSALTVIAVSGEDVQELLAKGCSLDLHLRAFAVERCARTHLARAVVILERIDNASMPTWHIYVVNSFASYLVDWLIDASADLSREK